MCLSRTKWQEELVDRFDGRNQLDFYTEPKDNDDEGTASVEEKRVNFERYRVLIQNEISNGENFSLQTRFNAKF